METWKQQVRQLKKETYAIYVACKDPRVPWYARVFAGFVVAYAFSPIDTELQLLVEFNKPLQALQDAELRERESYTFECNLV